MLTMKSSRKRSFSTANENDVLDSIDQNVINQRHLDLAQSCIDLISKLVHQHLKYTKQLLQIVAPNATGMKTT